MAQYKERLTIPIRQILEIVSGNDIEQEKRGKKVGTKVTRVATSTCADDKIERLDRR